MDAHDRELLKQEIKQELREKIMKDLTSSCRNNSSSYEHEKRKQEILKAIDENTPTTAWEAFKQGFLSA